MTLTRKILVAALALAVVACARATRIASDRPELRVMTWNIQAGGKGLDSLAAVIRAATPDVVGLQEVDMHWSERSAFADQAGELASRLGMRVLFAPIYSIANADAARPERQFGVAVLTRLPVVRWANDSLTRLSTQVANAAPTRMPGLLEADIDVRGTRVRVFTTHLDYRADPFVRRQQVAEIVRYLGTTSLPAVLVGDLNASPEAPELAPLFGPLRDAWRGGSSDGFTYPSERPVKRIDYVLASPHFTAIDAVVLETAVSDHRPVLARLRLP